MADENKKARKARKSVLTREINQIRRLMAENRPDDVKNRFPGLKDKFAEFEKAHEQFHATLLQDDQIDESEDYFTEVENNYIESTLSIRNWIDTTQVKDVKAPVTTIDRKEFNQEDFMAIMNLPKVEIECFDGSPLKYHYFMALFDEQIHKTRLDPSMKLTRLLQYTSGRAKEAIQACVLQGNEGYDEARVILKRRFGNNLMISDYVIKNIKSGNAIKTPQDLLKFSDELNSCRATLNSMGMLNEIDTQSSIIVILDRLPPYLCKRWKRQALEYKREKDAYPRFGDFVKFISTEAEEATDPVYGGIGISTRQSDEKQIMTSSFSSDVLPQSNYMSSCVACGKAHRLFSCEKFKSLRPMERLDLVQRHKLCENCLLDNHCTSQCRKPSFCSVPGCGMKHTRYIHILQDKHPVDTITSRPTTSRDLHSNRVEVLHTSSEDSVDVMLPVVKVNVNNRIETFALLDNGSTNSFCTEKLVEDLHVKGKVVNYRLTTLSTSCDRQSVVVDLNLTSSDCLSKMKLSNVYVVKEIPVNVPNIDVNLYPHLSDLPVHIANSVDILIGQCHAEALIPTQVRRGTTVDPFAVKTLFGWSLNGPITGPGSVSKKIISNFVTSQPCNIQNDEIVYVGSTINHTVLDDSLVAGMESTVNCQPLLSDQVENMMNLTPNNLLLMQGRLFAQLGNYSKRNMLCRRWHIPNQFWHRWIIANLPDLQKRSKWRDKGHILKVGNLVMINDRKHSKEL